MNIKTSVMLGGLALLGSGCAASRLSAAPNEEAPQVPSGPQVWAETCGQCHGIRAPGSYSDAQWDVAVAHMRLRANLTAEDARVVLGFLKSAN